MWRIFLILIGVSSIEDSNSKLVAVECELLITPLLMAFFVLLPDYLLNTANNLQRLIWVIIIANIGALFYTAFSFRYIDQIGFGSSLSIYMGILLAVCALFVRSRYGFFL